MTTDERKRGLRAAVRAKVPNLGLAVSYERHVELLWQVIDSLVEECAEYQEALSKVRQYLDYPGNGIPAIGAGAATVQVCLELIDKTWPPELPCHLCGKAKGQPPERCPGHYETVRLADKEPCSACNDTGYLTVSVDGHEAPDGMVYVQRCDNCDKFGSDISAAQEYGGGRLAILCRKKEA